MADACSINAEGIQYIASAVGFIGVAFAAAWALRGYFQLLKR